MFDHPSQDFSPSIRSDSAVHARVQPVAPPAPTPNLLQAQSTAPRLEAGDRVRLGSGGALMTIERADYRVERPFAFCSWMDARDKIHRASINIDALELVALRGEPMP